MHVKPNPQSVASNPDFKVRDPITKAWLPDEGSVVDDSGYWQRRVAQGDVVLVEPPRAQKMTSAKSSTSKGDAE